MRQWIPCRNVLLWHAYVLHPKAGPSLLLRVGSVWAKETAGAASCCLTHYQQPIVCLQAVQAVLPNDEAYADSMLLHVHMMAADRSVKKSAQM